MMKRKAELSINLIVVVAIALLILVILVVIIGERFIDFRRTTECVAANGECVSERNCNNVLDRDMCGPFQVCCSVIE